MKVYLIHHSHTDLGYTELPTRTLASQLRSIDYLVDYYMKNPNTNFKWNCETLYIVEKWIESRNEAKVKKFFELVNDQKIGISANYLNMADLCFADIYDAQVARSIEKVNQQTKITSYLQADVNGLPLHYARTLIKNGIKNIYAFVHTHHGMFPVFKKHSFFEWEIDGKILNVFSGEHYMFGNSFGFVPGAVTRFGFGDDDLFDDYRMGKRPLIELSKRRLDIFTNNLKEQGYEDDFVCFGIHSKLTDNAMPRPEILDQINAFNEVYGDEFYVELVTLDEFFEKTSNVKKPRYQGEWPDWWTDGVGSAPRETKMCKNISNKYKQLKMLGAESIDIKACHEIEEKLVIYGEHTYGSNDSIVNPYGKFASEQFALKQKILFDALELVTILEDDVLETLGKNENANVVAKRFKAINPYDYKIKEHVRLPIHGSDWNSLNGKYKITDNLGHEYVYNVKLGRVDEVRDAFHGKTQEASEVFPEVIIELEAGQEKIIQIEQLSYLISKPMPVINQRQIGGTDCVDDLKVKNNLEYYFSANSYKNKYLEIYWNSDGIYKIFNKETNVNLLNDNGFIFRPIFEITKDTPRNFMGRNRKGIGVKRDFGKVKNVELITQNHIYAKINIYYEVNGISEYIIEMIVSNYSSKITFNIKVGKDTSFFPENVYLDLPIADGNRDIIFCKGGIDTRPLHDQLPGTLIDFYSVYDGIKVRGKSSFSLTTADTQLVHVGDLEFRERELFEKPKKVNEVYIWLMNNIWETNFVANIGGFYEFKYVLDCNKDNAPKYHINDVIVFPILEK